MKKFIFPVVTILIIGALVLINYFQQRVPENPEGTLGNTSGNLLNGGLFCEHSGKIYFSNPSDEGRLYVIDKDLSVLDCLSDDTAAQINAAGNFLYYSRRNDTREKDTGSIFIFKNVGLYRMTLEGKRPKTIYDNAVGYSLLSGNNLFYQHYSDEKRTECYRTNISGKDSVKIHNDIIVPAVSRGNRIFYTGVSDDHFIHSMNSNGGDDQILFEGNCASLISDGDKFYFLDLDNNYGISCVNADGSGYTQLVSEFVSTFNISAEGRTLYYQVDGGDHNGIYSFDLDTQTQSLIAEGDYNSIHTTSRYVFFRDFHTEKFYVMTYDGEPEAFTPEKIEE